MLNQLLKIAEKTQPDCIIHFIHLGDCKNGYSESLRLHLVQHRRISGRLVDHFPVLAHQLADAG